MKHNESRDRDSTGDKASSFITYFCKEFERFDDRDAKDEKEDFFKGGLKGDNMDLFLMFVVTVVMDERIPGGSACK